MSACGGERFADEDAVLVRQGEHGADEVGVARAGDDEHLRRARERGVRHGDGGAVGRAGFQKVRRRGFGRKGDEVALRGRFVVVDGEFDPAPVRQAAGERRKERGRLLYVARGIGRENDRQHRGAVAVSGGIQKGRGEEGEVVGDLHLLRRKAQPAFRRDRKPQRFVGGVFAHGLVVAHELQHELVLGLQELHVQRHFGAGALAQKLFFQLHRGLQLAV